MRFVDTSFWVALFFERNSHHVTARDLWSAKSGTLLSTTHVMGETWTFIHRRRGHADAVRASAGFIEVRPTSPPTAHAGRAGRPTDRHSAPNSARPWVWLDDPANAVTTLA